MSSFSQKLTDIYYLFDKYERDLEPIYDPQFKEYLNSQPTVQDFVKTIFTIGFEIRDLPLDQYEDQVEHLIQLIEEVSPKFDFKSNKEYLTIYNIGMINCYLYFCIQNSNQVIPSNKELPVQIKDLDPESFEIVLPETEESKTPIHYVKNIKQSVEYLRRAFKLCHETMDISSGVYTYHVHRLFDYIFSIFEHYKVENNNIPVDLDSFYVFTDQTESNSPLWLELEKQIKSKYDL